MTIFQKNNLLMLLNKQSEIIGINTYKTSQSVFKTVSEWLGSDNRVVWLVVEESKADKDYTYWIRYPGSNQYVKILQLLIGQ